MKNLVLAFSLLVSSLTFAAEVKIYEAPTWMGDSASATFAVNEELGRAWVEIHISDNYDVEDMGTTERVKVPGLSYDNSAKAILLDIDGQLVECAQLKKRGISVFRHNLIKESGCHFTSKVVKKMVDDGFEIKKKNYLQVFLITKE